jgi:hypothetical protein
LPRAPGFRRWLENRLAGGEEPEAALLASLEMVGWRKTRPGQKPLRRPLLRLCATYLTGAGGPKSSADPVARFHLSDGARLERVNWLGNIAPRDIQEAYGIMVHYLYDPKRSRPTKRPSRRMARTCALPKGTPCSSLPHRHPASLPPKTDPATIPPGVYART